MTGRFALTLPRGSRAAVAAVRAIVAGTLLAACSGEVPDRAFVHVRITARPCTEEESQSAMTHCALGEAQSAEVHLNQLMGELEGVLDPERFAALRATQQDWARWRHDYCTWEAAAADGGSVQPMVYAGCMAGETQRRIGALKYHLCEGAGMTGDCEASRRYDP